MKELAKSDESNRKRLESLKQQAEEFKLKKTLIKNSLNNLDGESKPKKIVFKDSDSDTEILPKKTKIVETIKPKPRTNLKKKDSSKLEVNSEKKKFNLIGSDDDEDEDDFEAKKMFESKLNLNETQANKLIYLKSKYSNDDKRFKIDERFAEDDEIGQDKSKKLKKTKRKTESDDDDDSDDDRNVSQNMDDDDFIPKTNRKQIKDENLNSLKILEQITGKQILKPQAPSTNSDSQKDGHTKKTINKMIRYDPTKDEHKKFEIAKEESSESDDDDDALSASKKKTTTTDQEPTRVPKIEEDLSKFYEIEPNLKELFSSNDVFKFKFTNDDKDDSENEYLNNEETEPVKKLKDFSSFEVNRKQRNDKLSSSEDDDGDTDDDDENEYEEDEELVQKKSKESHEKNVKKFENLKLVEVPKTFLPDFVNNKEIKEGLVFFKKVEHSREDWLKKREFLVKEYKKKHKRMIRIKKNKENEKLLPWKLTKK